MINLQIIIIVLCFIELSSAQITAETDNFFLTEQQDSIFIKGVVVDYSFNETSSQNDSSEKFISSPGCPVSSEPGSFELHGFNRNFWVQYGSPLRCFLVGTQGPCPNGTLMGPLINSPLGICVCSCFLNERSKPFQPSEDSICYDNGQHHAFVSGTCHAILSQGPCDLNEVLLVDPSKNIPECKLRDCPKGNISQDQATKYSFRFKINNTCHGVGDQYCNLRSEETSGHTTGFYTRGFSPVYWEFDVEPNNPFPSCLEKFRGSYGGWLAAQLNEYSCHKQLEKYSQVLKRCVPIGFFGRRINIG